MAVTFTLTSTALTTIDFTTGTDFTLGADYVPTVATPNGDGSIPAYVVETIPVVLRATSENDLATTMQELSAMQKRAAEYWLDMNEDDPVWLTCKLDTETTGRRALVKRIDFAFERAPQSFYEECGTTLADFYLGTVLIERHPYWEALSTTAISGTSIGYLGDTIAINGVPGDVNARFHLIKLAGTMNMEWPRYGVFIGIRSANRHGTLANFVPLWECEDGTNVTDCTDTPEVTASGGDMVVCDFTDPSLQERVELALSDITANYTDNYGQYLCILRAKLGSNASVVRVRVKVRGNSSGTNETAVYNDKIAITSTSWAVYSMGVVTLPLAGDRMRTASYSPARDCVVIEAQRDSGGADLHMDCIVLIPIDEAWLVVPPGSGLYSFANDDFHEVEWRPNDDHTPFFHYDSTNYVHYAPGAACSNGFGIPPGNNILVLCGYADVGDADMTISGSYYPRWGILRGTE